MLYEVLVKEAKRQIRKKVDDMVADVENDPTHAFAWIYTHLSDLYESGIVIKLPKHEFQRLLEHAKRWYNG